MNNPEQLEQEIPSEIQAIMNHPCYKLTLLVVLTKLNMAAKFDLERDRQRFQEHLDYQKEHQPEKYFQTLEKLTDNPDPVLTELNAKRDFIAQLIMNQLPENWHATIPLAHSSGIPSLENIFYELISEVYSVESYTESISDFEHKTKGPKRKLDFIILMAIAGNEEWSSRAFNGFIKDFDFVEVTNYFNPYE
jgi:hypothetical protein